MQRRLSEISSFEVILCLSVVMIHILSESIASYAKGTILSFLSFSASTVLTFVVPAFMISAGIKFAHKFENTAFNYLSFMRGRLTKIYLPYVIFTVIHYLYFVFYRKYFGFDFLELLNYILHGSIVAPFYFIALIMQFYILSPVIMMFCRIIPSNLGILIAAIINIVCLYFSGGLQYGDRIFTVYLLYWTIGCYIGMDFRSAISRLSRLKKIIVPLGIIFTVIYVGVSYAQFLGLFNSFLTEILKIAFCLSASFMWLVLMPKSEGFIADSLAPVTFYVFLIHCLVIIETQFLLTNWGITSIPLRFIITFFSAYIISLVVSIVFLKIKGLFIKSKQNSFW